MGDCVRCDVIRAKLLTRAMLLAGKKLHEVADYLSKQQGARYTISVKQSNAVSRLSNEAYVLVTCTLFRQNTKPPFLPITIYTQTQARFEHEP